MPGDIRELPYAGEIELQGSVGQIPFDKRIKI
jgi:hypothetical protein